MPRGVYDRSKMKKKGSEAKADTSAPALKKNGRKAKQAQADAPGIGQVASESSHRKYELQTAITTLTNVRTAVGNNTGLVGTIDSNLQKAVVEYGSLLFPLPKAETKNGAEAASAPVAAAPVPFNPPTFPQPSQA